MSTKVKVVKAISLEGIIWLVLIFGFFTMFAVKMGIAHMFGTMMATAHDLVLNTSFFISAVCILAGGVSALFTEFGVLAVINRALSPLMKPLFNLPGASIVGAMATYLSDNPAILSLTADKNFRRYFRRYQYVSLTNLGTAFGMGLIVTTFMLAQGSIRNENFVGPVLIGNLAMVLGCIVSVRLMQWVGKKEFGIEEPAEMESTEGEDSFDILECREIREGNRVQRFIEALLDGSKAGFDTSLLAIPGVAIICTMIMMLLKGPGPEGEYTGAAYQGIQILPVIGSYMNVVLGPLLGFTNPAAIAFPLTSLGAVGAALGTVPQLLKDGSIGGNEIAVFTGMGMCWSGFLTTHVAMMEAMAVRYLAVKAILCHLVGGFMAGVFAHFIYVLIY